jgi:hypothetical protein
MQKGKCGSYSSEVPCSLIILLEQGAEYSFTVSSTTSRGHDPGDFALMVQDASCPCQSGISSTGALRWHFILQWRIIRCCVIWLEKQ